MVELALHAPSVVLSRWEEEEEDDDEDDAEEEDCSSFGRISFVHRYSTADIHDHSPPTIPVSAQSEPTVFAVVIVIVAVAVAEADEVVVDEVDIVLLW